MKKWFSFLYNVALNKRLVYLEALININIIVSTLSNNKNGFYYSFVSEKKF